MDCRKPMMRDALALLKEQEEHSHELQQIINDGFEAMKIATKRIKELEVLLKEQDERIKEFELEKGWDESPDMMGKW